MKQKPQAIVSAVESPSRFPRRRPLNPFFLTGVENFVSSASTGVTALPISEAEAFRIYTLARQVETWDAPKVLPQLSKRLSPMYNHCFQLSCTAKSSDDTMFVNIVISCIPAALDYGEDGVPRTQRYHVKRRMKPQVVNFKLSSKGGRYYVSVQGNGTYLLLGADAILPGNKKIRAMPDVSSISSEKEFFIAGVMKPLSFVCDFLEQAELGLYAGVKFLRNISPEKMLVWNIGVTRYCRIGQEIKDRISFFKSIFAVYKLAHVFSRQTHFDMSDLKNLRSEIYRFSPSSGDSEFSTLDDKQWHRQQKRQKFDSGGRYVGEDYVYGVRVSRTSGGKPYADVSFFSPYFQGEKTFNRLNAEGISDLERNNVSLNVYLASLWLHNHRLFTVKDLADYFYTMDSEGILGVDKTIESVVASLDYPYWMSLKCMNCLRNKEDFKAWAKGKLSTVLDNNSKGKAKTKELANKAMQLLRAWYEEDSPEYIASAQAIFLREFYGVTDASDAMEPDQAESFRRCRNFIRTHLDIDIIYPRVFHRAVLYKLWESTLTTQEVVHADELVRPSIPMMGHAIKETYRIQDLLDTTAIPIKVSPELKAQWA